MSSSVIMVRPTVSPPPSPAPASRPLPNDDYDSRLNPPAADSELGKSTSLSVHGLAKYGKTALMGLTGFVLALATWEAILQLTVESRRGPAEHSALGRIENPGWMLNTREGRSRTRLNSLGMRAPEPTAKQLGEYRILVLGDSFTRADEVADGLNFSDRLQSSLAESVALKAPPAQDVSSTEGLSNKQPQRFVQVINAGKPSASPASYLYAADFHTQTFEPDSTVIQLTDSDFREDMNNAVSEFYVAPSERSGDYDLLRNETFGSVDPLAQAITKYAPPLRPLKQMSALRVGGRNLHGSVSPVDDFSETVGASADESADELQALKAEDAALVRWTLNQLQQKFPNVVLVYLPAVNYQDAGAVSSDPRNAALESALEQTAAQAGIPLLNMRSDFLAHFRTQGTHIKGFHNTVPGQGHLNRVGHELVARRLIDFYQNSDSFTGFTASGLSVPPVPSKKRQASSDQFSSKQSHGASDS